MIAINRLIQYVTPGQNIVWYLKSVFSSGHFVTRRVMRCTEELQSCARSELTVSGSGYLYFGSRDALYPLQLNQSSSYLVSSLATCLGGAFIHPSSSYYGEGIRHRACVRFRNLFVEMMFLWSYY